MIVAYYRRKNNSMNKEIDAEKLINKLLAKITQLEFDNAKLTVLVEGYEAEHSKEGDS